MNCLPALDEADVVLITGGTGSFGQALTQRLAAQASPPRIRIYSRDEHKQEAMQAAFPAGERLSYILGDVRDAAQLGRAMDGATHVVHAAALKRVPLGERHAPEFVRTNVLGTMNVIGAAIDNRVGRCLLISSDKAVAAYNAYGRTKAVAESLFVQANALGVSRGASFSIVRGGNVWGSRGSVMEVWRAAQAEGRPLPITDEAATRFYLPMADWLDFCLAALAQMRGGEVFVPKLRAWRLGDLAEAFGGDLAEAGAREGDKRHETLISLDEAATGRALDIGWSLVVEPAAALCEVWTREAWAGERVRSEYRSDEVERLTARELREALGGMMIAW